MKYWIVLKLLMRMLANTMNTVECIEDGPMIRNCSAQSVLKVESLFTGYRKKEILKSVSLDVRRGEIVTIIGHNGAGKSTLLKAMFGIIPIWSGRVLIDGQEVNSPEPRTLLCQGVAYLPQGNRVFPNLTVQENLEMGGVTMPDKSKVAASIEMSLNYFPILGKKLKDLAGTLSGGEKQMLALSNALIISPKILLLDEPSLGLAPLLVTETLERIKELSLSRKVSVMIVEQKVRQVLKIADRVCVLRNGCVSYTGEAEELRDEDKLREVYL